VDSEKPDQAGPATPVPATDPFPARVAGPIPAAVAEPSSPPAEAADLRASFESLGNLAAGVAHAFSNALTAIGGSAELLRERVTDPVAVEDVERIRATVAHASVITRQLLRLADRQVVRPEVINLGEQVEQIIGWLGALLGENLRLETEIDPAAGPVRVDPDEVAEAILVLATNARDAMAGEGTLHIGVRRIELDAPLQPQAVPAPGPRLGSPPEGWRPGPTAIPHSIGDPVPAGSWVVLEVVDYGIGMSLEAQRNLFRPFFTTKRGRGAAGLGLAAVHAVAIRAGGAVSVTTAPDEGTTVRIHFPSLDRPHGSGAVDGSAPAAASTRGLTALLVEDDPDVRAFTTSALRRLGFEVLSAGNPEEAIGRAAAHPEPIALLVSDVVMPEMTGPSLAAQLASVRVDLAVLFMSGHAFEAGPQVLELPRGSTFLRKPFGVQDLARAVAEAMGPAPVGGAPRGRLNRTTRPR
jgi:two-component system, cell cycle sensor histidine kinase and response regulator CckA